MPSNHHSHRRLWAILAVIIIASLLLAGCGQPSKTYRVGILGFPGFTQITDGFKAKMAELGYEEGKNITYDVQLWNAAVDSLDAGTQMVKKFVSDGADLVVSFPT